MCKPPLAHNHPNCQQKHHPPHPRSNVPATTHTQPSQPPSKTPSTPYRPLCDSHHSHITNQPAPQTATTTGVPNNPVTRLASADIKTGYEIHPREPIAPPPRRGPTPHIVQNISSGAQSHPTVQSPAIALAPLDARSPTAFRSMPSILMPAMHPRTWCRAQQASPTARAFCLCRLESANTPHNNVMQPTSATGTTRAPSAAHPAQLAHHASPSTGGTHGNWHTHPIFHIFHARHVGLRHRRAQPT